jgi:amidohydrolase
MLMTAGSETLSRDLVAWRRHFHRHPELGFKEHDTARFILDTLAVIGGLEVTHPVAETGIVALLRGAKPGPTLLVRADMDALPIHELNDVSYRSTRDGVMHACGHDAHMAMQLGAIQQLVARRAELAGQVKFVFQPAEEGPGGAKPMIDAGVMLNPTVDAAIGFHIWTPLPVGTIGITEGPCMAHTDEFEINIQGKGGHGAAPHLSVDSVVVAAHVVTALQSVVARNVDPIERAVVTVGKVEAGDRHNIIAHSARMTGTARSFAPAIADLLPQRVGAIAHHVCEAFGARCHLDYRNVYPATVNDPDMCRRVWASAEKVVGPGKVVAAPASMGGEDMSYFLQAVPGCYFFIGAANPEKGANMPHHHPQFAIDEDALGVGCAVITQAVIDFLASPAP